MVFAEFIRSIKNGCGMFRPNDQKTKAKQPDVRGYFRMPDRPETTKAGQLVELVGWTRRATWHKPTLAVKVEVIENEPEYVADRVAKFEEWKRKRDGAKCWEFLDRQDKERKEEEEKEGEEPEGEL
jgi:hypothetical protein